MNFIKPNDKIKYELKYFKYVKNMLIILSLNKYIKYTFSNVLKYFTSWIFFIILIFILKFKFDPAIIYISL